MMNYVYLVELDEDTVDSCGINGCLVIASSTEAAINICVDNAKPQDIDLWYKSNVTTICESQPCLEERGTQIILTGRAWS